MELFKPDEELDRVHAWLISRPDCEEHIGAALRLAFDQIYDGQHTGRFAPEQLAKVEKTHLGSLVEINLQRRLGLDDGSKLDFRIAGVEVDCKYSQRLGGWMIPPEAVGELCLVVHASDPEATWQMGLVRCSENVLSRSSNRDAKRSLSSAGRDSIVWLWTDVGLPPNVLITLDQDDIDVIFESRWGQQRVDQLFRVVQGRLIGRNTVATVAMQDDYMKRVRWNGGSRSRLQDEGIIILGDSLEHREIAAKLSLPVPGPGSFVAATVTEAANGVPIDGRLWKVVAQGTQPVAPGPRLPDKKTARGRSH